MRAFKAQTQPVIDALTTRSLLQVIDLSDDNDGVVAVSLALPQFPPM